MGDRGFDDEEERDELRALGIDGVGHGGSPFRIGAMGMTFIGNFRRSMTPFMCNRHDFRGNLGC